MLPAPQKFPWPGVGCAVLAATLPASANLVPNGNFAIRLDVESGDAPDGVDAISQTGIPFEAGESCRFSSHLWDEQSRTVIDASIAEPATIHLADDRQTQCSEE